jgi:S1-C subfamily serine protease
VFVEQWGRRLRYLRASPPFILVLLIALSAAPCRAELTAVIEKVRPAIVGVGTYEKTRAPAVIFRGTGFAVGDGLHVVTNAHVIPGVLDIDRKEILIVIVGRGRDAQPRQAERIAQDPEHDLAVLKIQGEPLPTLTIGDSSAVREGQEYAFTGFPIGVVLGAYPVTHRAMISALTPIVIPSANSQHLDPKVVNRLRSPFEVFQLDGTAYPGNSGSPLYDRQTGRVIGILNMTFVKGTKEMALSEPSGISYAIPGNYISVFLRDSHVMK